MKRRVRFFALSLSLSATLVSWPNFASAQPATLSGLTSEQTALLNEHVYQGLPTVQPVLVRKGYVALYDPTRRDPLWVAYHVVPDYRNTPQRQDAFVRWLDGIRTEIRVVNGPTGKYLRTDRDQTSHNNLDDLPDC